MLATHYFREPLRDANEIRYDEEAPAPSNHILLPDEIREPAGAHLMSEEEAMREVKNNNLFRFLDLMSVLVLGYVVY
jgi:hypothetical protein